MALFHFTVDQMKCSEGQSAIALAAYRSGERLYSEYYGEYSDYTRKDGVICSDILLPSHAPPEFADRQTSCGSTEDTNRILFVCFPIVELAAALSHSTKKKYWNTR